MEVQNLAGLGIDQARQGTPQKPAFDASNVNDQLGATLNQGGLLMRMAQSKGQGVASARGLGNSTIGIDAAQRAMVDAALPIAQQNAQQTHQRVMQDDSQSFTAGQADLDRKQQTSMLDKQQSWQGGQNALDRQQQLTMQGNDFSNQSKLNQQQAQLQERRDQLLYQQQLGTLDKQSQLELKQLDAQLKNQTTLNDQQFGQQKELNQQQAYLQAERDSLLNKFQQGMLDKEGQQRLRELDVQLKNEMALNNQQNQQQLTLLEKQFGQETSQLAQQVAANTHGMYLSAIDTAMSSYNERYAALMADSTIKTADKTTMLNNMKNELNSTLTMYQKLYSNINTINPDWTKFPTTSLPGVKVS
ncbi:hypothetical protein [Aeromonas hydrophila]|uniref:hypothetical protein n=1 Tax=Aeromonas hydrophila TaxID=644 RepID=UPI00259F0686|nr:hypothetical protein [Aeromonas hydrophila]MDM5117188.1 hypothetical protein [Aeromonas hydrophila]